jgi:transposase InsO family protein
VSHANAILTPAGRLRLARLIVDQGWTYVRAAERFSVGVGTARKWAGRYRLLGAAGMADRSSRPRRSPNRLPQRIERRIVKLRVVRRWGPVRIGYQLGLNPATGVRIKTSRADRRSYEHAAPGDLVHVDVKKLGRIPDGGGWRFRGPAAGKRNKQRKPAGYAYLHHAVDDHSRLAYSEILHDQKQETAAAFWQRAEAYFHICGITVRAVLTDNGNAYRSKLWANTLSTRIKHRRTRPYRPQTNGKVERFNRTLLEEWAYAAEYLSETDRAAAYPTWLHHYNHHRGHTALGGSSPADRVPNLSGQNT